jgi:hypothetical protein
MERHAVPLLQVSCRVEPGLPRRDARSDPDSMVGEQKRGQTRGHQLHLFTRPSMHRSPVARLLRSHTADTTKMLERNPFQPLALQVLEQT